jgi:hypothetical protein
MPIGFLETLIADVRLAMDDSAVSETYSNAEILRRANAACTMVFQDLQAISSTPFTVQHDFTLTAGTTVYQLPPSIGRIYELGSWNNDTKSWNWIIGKGDHVGFFRPGVFLSGNRITLDKGPDSDIDLRIEYVPSGDFKPHAGKVSIPGSYDDLTMPLVDPADESTDLNFGEVDDRAGAYVGGILRIWPDASGTAPQTTLDRLVTGHTLHDSTRYRRVTVDVPFTGRTKDGVTEYQYEILPVYMPMISNLVMIHTAMQLCSFSSMSEKRRLLQADYQSAVRTARLAEANRTVHGMEWRRDVSHQRGPRRNGI